MVTCGVCVCVRAPVVITSSTAGEDCVHFDGETGERKGRGVGGGGGERVASLSLPRPSCSPHFSVSLVW